MLYDERLLVDYIFEKTGYKTALGDTQTLDQTDTKQDTIRVFVTHLRQVPFNPSNDERVSNHYNDFNVSMLVTTQIQLHCKRSLLTTTWNTLEEQLKNFTPFIGDGEFSNLTLIEAGLSALAADKVMWVSEWSLITPRIS